MPFCFAQTVFLHLVKDNPSVKIKPIQQFKNEKETTSFLKTTQQALIIKGFLEASFDSIKKSNDTLYAVLHIGNKYKVSIPTDDAGKRKSKKKYSANIFDDKVVKENILKNLENNGYPFAKIIADSIVMNDSVLNISYAVDNGKLISIDSFLNYGNSKITKGFIQNYLLLKSKHPYNEQKVKNIDKLLQKLPYATLRQPTNIIFRDNKADVHLYLDKRKVNSFDFLIGFLPGSNNGKILITGEARIHLQNAFKRGEELYFEWRKLQRQSQLLDVRLNYPYLFNTPLGVNFTFNLEKRDSSSLDLAWQLGLPYITGSNNYIKGFYKYTQTIILAADTSFVKLYRALPTNLDAVYNQYGVQSYYEHLDYLFSPKKGYDLKLSASIGTKKIKQNNQITTLQDAYSDFNYASLYDSIKRLSIKGDIFWQGNYYLPLGKKQMHILKFAINGGAVFNHQLLKNELLRIGGSKLLRGFDEQSIYASAYNTATLEYRLMIMRNSYFFLFFDAAYIQRKFNNTTFQDFPFGFGAGVTFDTKIGIFGLTYALGQQKYHTIDFRNSKIHFGYVAKF